MVLISIQAWLLLKLTDTLYCVSLTTYILVLDWLTLALATIGHMLGWIPVGLSTYECVADSCTIMWDPAHCCLLVDFHEVVAMKRHFLFVI